jgi:hypothetical protein
MPFLILLLAASLATAPFARAAEPGEELTISLLTIDPGDLVFEKFGHDGILIEDANAPAGSQRFFYHWGNFDFGQKSFFINYARGRMDYSMDRAPLEDLGGYAADDRRIVRQELNLSPAQRSELRKKLLVNLQPENRVYSYNYYTDNCATRARDAIDAAVGGQLKSQLTPQPTDTTFRWHTRRLARDDLFWYAALHTVLGPLTDRKINQWEEAFLPLKLRDHLRHATVTNPATGQVEPIVKAETEISPSTRPPEPTAPPRWTIHFFATGLVIAAGLVGFVAWAMRGPAGRRGGKIAFAVAATLYAAFLGICAFIGLWFWLLSDHWAAWRNENLFGYSPLAIPLAFLIPVLFRKPGRVKRHAAGLAIAIAASTLLGVLLAPLLPQDVAEPMALVLAPNLALGWCVWRLTVGVPTHAEIVATTRTTKV